MTVAFSKKRFLKYLRNQIRDTDVILFTLDTTQMNFKPKKKSKEITFEFYSDAFVSQTGIGHFAKGITPAAAICFCPKEEVTSEIIGLVKMGDKKDGIR